MLSSGVAWIPSKGSCKKSSSLNGRAEKRRTFLFLRLSYVIYKTNHIICISVLIQRRSSANPCQTKDGLNMIDRLIKEPDGLSDKENYRAGLASD